MTITEEGYRNWKIQWEASVAKAESEAPEGFELIGFLWGWDYTHGPFLSSREKPGPTDRAIYAKRNNA